MRLTLQLPEQARETVQDNGVVVVMFETQPLLQIDIFPLHQAPTKIAEWMTHAIVHDATDPSSIRVLGSARLFTRDGWPCEVVDVVVPGDSIEHRLVGLYEMLGHVASITVRFLDTAVYERERERCLTLLQTARPTWRSEAPVAVVELWSLDVTQPSG